MIILEIAAGIVVAYLALAYLGEILALGIGVVLVIAAFIVLATIISTGWQGAASLAAIAAFVAGALYLHRRRHSEDWDSLVSNNAKASNDGLAATPAGESLSSEVEMARLFEGPMRGDSQ